MKKEHLRVRNGHLSNRAQGLLWGQIQTQECFETFFSLSYVTILFLLEGGGTGRCYNTPGIELIEVKYIQIAQNRISVVVIIW